MNMLFLLVVGVMVTYVPVDSQFLTPCAATDCIPNTICRDILNRTSGVIFAACLDPVQYPPTGNEQRCRNGQPLWVVSSNGSYSEETCGRVADSCPSGYRCVIGHHDSYGVCCPTKRGHCPQPGDVEICVFTCESDDDCSNLQKCCRNACGGTSCSLPIY